MHICKLEKFHYFGVSIYCASGSIKWVFYTVILYKNAEELLIIIKAKVIKPQFSQYSSI